MADLFTMHENSLENWRNDVFPTLKIRQKEVLEAIISLKKCTCEQVAKYMGKYPNQISGRFTELKKAGVIKPIDKIKVGTRSHDVFTLNIDNQ